MGSVAPDLAASWAAAMNIWDCQHPGCSRVAYGVGGAVGLRAIGWYFKIGPVILCPQHHPAGPAAAEVMANAAQAMLVESPAEIETLARHG